MNGVLSRNRRWLRGPLCGPIATQGRSYKGLAYLAPAAIAVLWVVASREHWMSEQILPAPALVWQNAVEFGSGELWGHLWISLQRLFWGLAVGIGSGLLLGVWLGASRRAQTLVLPTFVALAQIPTLAWIPLFMLFFGIGELLKLVVLVKAVVVPVTLHTLVGVRDAQPKLRGRRSTAAACLAIYCSCACCYRLPCPPSSPAYAWPWPPAGPRCWRSNCWPPAKGLAT